MQFSALYFAAVVAAATMSQCEVTHHGAPGFIANFFRYNLKSENGWKSSFFSGGYAKGGIQSQVSGVVDSNFRFNAPNRKVVNGSIYGHAVSISNYTIELSGYFTPKETGNHKFTVKSDNGVYLKIYRGVTCCKNLHGDRYGNYKLSARDKVGGGGKIESIKAKRKFFLEAGVHYYVKIVTFNWQGNGGLEAGFVSPANEVVKDIGHVIHQYQFDTSSCLSASKTADSEISKTSTLTRSVYNTTSILPTAISEVKGSSSISEIEAEPGSPISIWTSSSVSIFSSSSELLPSPVLSKLLSSTSPESVKRETDFEKETRTYATRNPITSCVTDCALETTFFHTSSWNDSLKFSSLYSSVASSYESTELSVLESDSTITETAFAIQKETVLVPGKSIESPSNSHKMSTIEKTKSFHFAITEKSDFHATSENVDDQETSYTIKFVYITSTKTGLETEATTLNLSRYENSGSMGKMFEFEGLLSAFAIIASICILTYL